MALLDLYRDERDEGEAPREFFRRVGKAEVAAALGDIVIKSDFSNVRDEDLKDLGKERTFEVAIGDGECAA